MPDDELPTTTRAHRRALRAGVVVLICTMVLIGFDVAEEIGLLAEDGLPALLGSALEAFEIASVLGLAAFTFYLFGVLRRMARHDASRERTLSLLRGQFGEVMAAKFDDWQLTPAERDVTMLILKGLSVADIAAARATAAGTVKAQSTAIFRKAGVRSKSELLSMLIDEFLDMPTNAAAGAPAMQAG